MRQFVKFICKNTRFYQIYKEYQWRKFAKQFGRITRTTTVSYNPNLVCKNMYLDDFVTIQSNTNFISNNGRLFVKKYSVISSGCIIIPGAHTLKVGLPFWLSAKHHIADKESDIVIGEDCWIGAGCILLPGVRIGRGCVIGAGSVVTKDVPDYAVAVGCPARIIASKFNFEDTVSHEKILYTPNERLDICYLKELFETSFKNKTAIGNNRLEKADAETIKKYNEIYGLYLNQE